MNLKILAKDLDKEFIKGNADIDIQGIAYDSRKVKDGFLFVCIEGLITDGHKYIDSAYKNGAVAIIIDKVVDNIPKDMIVIKVPESRQALSRLSAAYYNEPSKELKIIGVTGTNGKTSITYLIDAILEKNISSRAIIGTISKKIIDKVYNTSNTTPESYELQGLFKEMVDVGVELCTMEVSSHSLDLKRVEDVKFDIGIFTNLTPEHLDYHKNMENYKNAKKKLFYKTSKVNIINIDDKYGREIYEEIKKLPTQIITYGLKDDCDIRAKDISMHLNYSEFTLVTKGFTRKVRLNIPGEFSIYNVLGAISACIALGYGRDEILDGLNNIRTVRGRFELVENKKGITVIVDYAHTPDALENVLKAIRQFANNNIITLFGCGGDRDTIKRPVMGKIAYSMSDLTIVTNDNPRTEVPRSIVNDILSGIDKIDDNKLRVIFDRKEAIKTAIEIADKGDIVLIAGKGHETYQIIGKETFDFDDKEVAKECLERN